MDAMPRYRRWQLMAMEKNLLNIEHIVTSIADPTVFQKRDDGDGWTISEVLGHLVDVDSAFLERARCLAAGNPPPPPSGIDQDTRVKEQGYAGQNAQDLLEKWKQVRLPYRVLLASLPDDNAVWERPGRDADGGGFTLNDQIILTAYHDLDHLHQIVKIIRS